MLEIVPAAVQQPESPRLQRLMADLETNSGALAAFWAECAATGAPLIEAVASPAGATMVTFVWRETRPTSNVVLLEWISGEDFPDRQLTHLPGTDLWHRSMVMRDDIRTSYQFAPNDSLVRKADETDWETRQRGWVPDPLNPLRLVDERFEIDAGLLRFNDSVLALPRSAPEPWIVHDPAVPAGTVDHHTFASKILGNSRDLWVYTPAGYGDRRDSLPVLVLFDGERHDSVLRVPTVLDNLIAAGAIPPLVALMIGNVDRGTELPCSEPFAKALVDEMLPWLGERYRVTGDASERVVAGASYGGLAAAWAGLTHPEAFGNVLSQSGSYWWKPDPRNAELELVLGDAPEWAWLPARVATMEPVPVRFWMEVGRLENRTSGGDTPSMVACNRHMRDVLVSRGYAVTYREYSGGHDYVWWRSTLADGLIALLGDEG